MPRVLLALAIVGAVTGVAGVCLAICAQRAADDAGSEAHSAAREIDRLSVLAESLAETADDHGRRLRGVRSDISDSFDAKIDEMQRSIDALEQEVRLMGIDRALRR
jgi:hypothetical protein